MPQIPIRNIAIIAHVDHGKTTLVDALLRQSQTHLSKEASAGDLIMDSNELERERGITIFSKNASVVWQGVKINIVDTPGHADFGGEVERVLGMADGCLLLVDAKEGPMPQTRFVLRKALAMGLKVIVVVNKIDKPDARPDWVVDKTFELFCDLGATDEQADFPVIYASAKNGLAGLEANLSKMRDISPIFELILKEVPAPAGNPDSIFQMRVTSIVGDNFKGRIAIGRVENGQLIAGKELAHINREGQIKKFRPTAVMAFAGLGRVDVPSVACGDIAAVSGLADVNIGETISSVENSQALPLLFIEEPTIKMVFKVNDSPFGGREGQYTTSRQIRERLHKELETDMALRVTDLPDGATAGFEVAGRGELHLAILIERLRREGFEFAVSRPQVIEKEIAGKIAVPFERVFLEIPDEFAGAIISELGARHGQLEKMSTEGGITFLEYLIPTRGLIGFRGQFLTNTKGLGIMNSTFEDYRVDGGEWRGREKGSLIASEAGAVSQYALINLQDRGVMFAHPGDQVYKGQIVGEHCRKEDLPVNVCREKQLSNMRASGSGPTEHFDKPRTMDLEDCLEFIADDELVEVTPKSVRMRKKILDENEARRLAKGIKAN